MIENWINECKDLAPFLKEKLAADKKHSWRDAPYIHEDVRRMLSEHQPASYSGLGYIPVSAQYIWPLTPPAGGGYGLTYPWTPGGGGGGRGYGLSGAYSDLQLKYYALQNQLEVCAAQAAQIEQGNKILESISASTRERFGL